MRSLSAAPRLVELILRDEREFGHYRVDYAGSNRPATRVGLTPICMALYRIGPAARPALRAARLTREEYERTQESREWRADDALRAVEKAWAFTDVGVTALDYPSPTEGVEPRATTSSVSDPRPATR